MIRRVVALFVVYSIFAIGFFGLLGNDVSVSAQAQLNQMSESNFRSDRIIIKPKTGTPQRALRALHQSRGITVAARFPEIDNIEVLELPAGTDVRKALKLYSNDPVVEYAEPDYIISVNQRTRDEGAVTTVGANRSGEISGQAATRPSDMRTSLWGMHNSGQTGGKVDADIDAPEAWGVTSDASSVIVGVIDSGIDYNHPDLAANMWTNTREIPGNRRDDDGNGYIDDVYGINAIDGSGNPKDDLYHGTHVAGTIGAVGNNGIGVVGVAWSVKLMGLKFIASNGLGSTSDAIGCIDYARSMGAKVLNASWGGGGYSKALYDAISSANQAGIVFVAAAGNRADDNDGSDQYPANYDLPNVIAVAASDANDTLADFSNFGYDSVKIAAPGKEIYSTVPNSAYATLSGTSMAAPHVSGSLALLRAYRPELTTPKQLIDRIVQSSDALPTFASNTYSGGRLNVHNALTGRVRPIPHFTLDKPSGEPGSAIAFTDDSSGAITSRTIDFGDGSPVQSINGTVTKTYPVSGTYTVTLTVSSGGANFTRSRALVINPNYDVSSDAFSWVDTSGLSTIALEDDSVSGAIRLPFQFPFYGRQYSNVYIGSNGLLTFGNSISAHSGANRSIPFLARPNGAIYVYWDNLVPTSTSAIRYGDTPAGFVVSYEGLVPSYDSRSPLTFQVVLSRDGVVKMQYLDVKPSTSSGGGKFATIGVEDEVGGVGRQYSYDGSQPIANNTAIKFVMNTAQVPTAPSGLSAAAPTATTVNLAWTDNSNNESGFEVDSSLDGINFMRIETTRPGVKAYALTGLMGGTRYHYRVRAFNQYGVSAYTPVASVTTPTVPTAPTGLTAEAISPSQIDISWVDRSSNETGFKIERSTNNLTFTEIATVGAGVKSFSVTGLNLGTIYYFRVRAFSAAGDSSYSNIANATTLSLSAPGNFTASGASKTSIALRWTDTNRSELGYKVERFNGNTWVEIATVGTNRTSFTDSALPNTGSHSYRVRAFNSSGTSAYSPVRSARPLP